MNTEETTKITIDVPLELLAKIDQAAIDIGKDNNIEVSREWAAVMLINDSFEQRRIEKEHWEEARRRFPDSTVPWD